MGFGPFAVWSSNCGFGEYTGIGLEAAAGILGFRASGFVGIGVVSSGGSACLQCFIGSTRQDPNPVVFVGGTL